MSALGILHLEDSADDAELVSELLAAHGMAARIHRVETRAAYMAALARGGYDIILADYALPSFDGLEALDLALAHQPETPFMFVTGALQDDRAVETLRRGATDFIVKQRLVRLVPSIHRALRERAERAQRARAEAALSLLAAASARLASSLDLEAILGNLARLSVPALGDFCVVDVISDGERVAATHVDPGAVDLVQQLRIRARGHTEVHDPITPERLEQIAPDREQRAIVRALAPTSIVVVPMVVGGRTLGTFTLGYSTSRRHHDDRDVATAQNLAERAAVSVENAQLYREVLREVRSRNDLIATVSHDLRNPLQSIQMAASVLGQLVPAGDAVRTRIDSIARSAEHATRLLTDLLDLARFDAGNFVLDRGQHEIRPTVAESIELCTPLAERKQIRIIDDVPPGITAHCDRMRLAQILGNLMGNALKYTPDGGMISIGARMLPPGDAVEISVTDSGIGIPERDVPHLFDRFWQGSRRRDGVGLGLSIVKALVELHGGTLSVASTVGGGSTFSFTLPAFAPAVVTGRATVLVVDDDADTRISVAEILDEAGYHTLTAGNGVEALELLHREPRLHPSVILLDLRMPEMDARAFRREQTRDPLLKDIAVIVFSADDDVAAVAEELEASGYLNKPLGAQALLDAVASQARGQN